MWQQHGDYINSIVIHCETVVRTSGGEQTHTAHNTRMHIDHHNICKLRTLDHHTHIPRQTEVVQRACERLPSQLSWERLEQMVDGRVVDVTCDLPATIPSNFRGIHAGYKIDLFHADDRLWITKSLES